MNDLDPSILKCYYKDYYQDAIELTKVGVVTTCAVLCYAFSVKYKLNMLEIISFYSERGHK